MGEWRADPTGRHQYRWWDGTSWTDNVSNDGVNSVDPMSAVPAPGQVSAPPKKSPKWPYVLVGIFLLCVLAFAGCVTLVVVGVNEAVNELNAQQQRHAISSEQFDALELGMTRAEVVGALGREPQSTNEFVSEGVFSEEELRSGCIYYNRAGGLWGNTYQLCFEDDRLTSKNAYG